MPKKTGFRKLLVSDMKNLLMFLAIIGGVFLVLFKLFDGDISFLENYLLIAVTFSGGSLQSGSDNKTYLQFSYCRKRLFKYQSLLTLFRAAVIATIYTVIRFFFYDQYVVGFLEDSEATLAMYHRVPFIELWIFHWICFILLFLYLMVSATMLHSVITMPGKMSDVMEERRAKRKAKSRFYRFITCVGVNVPEFILLVAALVLLLFAYDALLTHTFPWRCVCMACILVADLVMYLIARYRYSPKYI